MFDKVNFGRARTVIGVDGDPLPILSFQTGSWKHDDVATALTSADGSFSVTPPENAIAFRLRYKGGAGECVIRAVSIPHEDIAGDDFDLAEHFVDAPGFDVPAGSYNSLKGGFARKSDLYFDLAGDGLAHAELHWMIGF